MIDAYTRCNVCETSPADCLYDGDPMCYDCRAATAKVKREHPELNEKEPCIGCGAEGCEDALCHAAVTQDEYERYCLNRVAPLGEEYWTVIRRDDKFYIVSTTDTFDAGWETMVFACDAQGSITSYADLACERYGRDDNAKANAWNGHHRMVNNFQP